MINDFQNLLAMENILVSKTNGTYCKIPSFKLSNKQIFLTQNVFNEN